MRIMLTIIVVLCMFLITNKLYRILINKVHKKWGLKGTVWADRILFTIVIAIAIATEMRFVYWIYMALLGHSLIRYNPWTLK